MWWRGPRITPLPTLEELERMTVYVDGKWISATHRMHIYIDGKWVKVYDYLQEEKSK
jgi:hypothetical protein